MVPCYPKVGVKHWSGLLLQTCNSLPPSLLSSYPLPAVRALGQAETENHHVRVLPPGTGHDPLYGLQVRFNYVGALRYINMNDHYFYEFLLPDELITVAWLRLKSPLCLLVLEHLFPLLCVSVRRVVWTASTNRLQTPSTTITSTKHKNMFPFSHVMHDLCMTLKMYTKLIRLILESQHTLCCPTHYLLPSGRLIGKHYSGDQ